MFFTDAKFFRSGRGETGQKSQAGTLERLVLSACVVGAYVPLPATTSGSMPAICSMRSRGDVPQITPTSIGRNKHG